jgi:hypothetical protein
MRTEYDYRLLIATVRRGDIDGEGWTDCPDGSDPNDR